MAKKQTIYRGIDRIPVFFEDTSPLSVNVFNITVLPNVLTAGKNLIKIRGNILNLKPGSSIDVEILDSNGNPIYTEFIDFVSLDGSRVLAIYIYEDTSPGECTITLLGRLQQLNGQPIPREFRDIPNVKWQTFLPINPTMDNNSELIFTSTPRLAIEENIGVQLDRIYQNGQFPEFEPVGPVSYNIRNNVPYIELDPDVNDTKFTGQMVNGIVTFSNITNPLPVPNITPDSTEFRGRIRKFLNDTIAVLYNPYIVQSTGSLSTHTFNSFDSSNISLKFEDDPVYFTTQNSESYALIQIKDLEPATGDISRVKIYSSGKGTVGSWELVNDITLDGTEIFIDSSGSLTPDESTGLFKSQTDIDTFWTAKFYQGNSIGTAPTLQSDSGSLMRGLSIVSSANIEPDDHILVAQHKDNFVGFFSSESIYRLSFDAACERTSVDNFKDPKLSIYLSGSAFGYDPQDVFNQGVLPVKLGRKIGELKLLNNDIKKFYNQQIEFESDSEGNGDILFVVENGSWQIGSIETNTFAEIGYTPNYTRVRTEIPTKHKSGNQVSFKVEYYNKYGAKSETISYLYDVPWEGGNRYIDGGFSMLTGSLTVGDALGNGVEIVGGGNTGYIRSLGYGGFKQATSGNGAGFLLFSGSALPFQTATSYEGVGLELVANENNFFEYRTNPSKLMVRTEAFFLGNPDTQFISGSNGSIEISSSGYHFKPNGEVTASSFLFGEKPDNFIQYSDGGQLTVKGDLSVDQIFTPALIGGSPSNVTNASASITSDGFAKFVSASIGGFVITPQQIKSSNENLILNDSGNIVGSNVNFTGGTIAGWSLASTQLSSISSDGGIKIDSSNKQIGLRTGSAVDTTIMTIGNLGSNKFGIRGRDANDRSKIIFKLGEDGNVIGGFEITDTKILGDNIIINSSGSIQTADYASDLKGWKLSSAFNGFLEVENAKIRGTLSTAVFEKETVNAVGGQLYVANSTTLTGSATNLAGNYLPTDTTMSVVNASGFAQDEILSLKKVSPTGFSTEYVKVVSSSRTDIGSDTDLTGELFLVRGYGNSFPAGPSASLGDTPGGAQSYSGSQVIVSTGKIGTGFIRLNANPNDQATPYMDIVERTGSGVYDVLLKARLGDLSGLADSDLVFGNSNPGFGLATDNVFLQGGITATFGSIGGFGITSNAISSSNDNLILRDSGQITGSNVLFSGGKITGDVEFTGQSDGGQVVFYDDFSRYPNNHNGPDLFSTSPNHSPNGASEGYYTFRNEDSTNTKVRHDDKGQFFGNYLQMGNNSGNDYTWIISNNVIPFNENSLYEVEVRVRNLGSNANSRFYAGLTMFSQSLQPVANNAPPGGVGGGYGSQHYIAASGIYQDTIDGWQIYKGYLQGTGSSASGNSGQRPDKTSPGTANPNAMSGFLSPLIIANFQNLAGQFLIDYIRVTEFSVGGGSTRISGDQIKTGTLESNNFSTVAGSRFKLDDGTFILGGSASPKLEFDGTTLTVDADITANEIRTPATIGGSASTTANASSSIDSDGFAKFVSASIGGFTVDTASIESPSFVAESETVITATLNTLVSASGTSTTCTNGDPVIPIFGASTNANATFWQNVSNLHLETNASVFKAGTTRCLITSLQSDFSSISTSETGAPQVSTSTGAWQFATLAGGTTFVSSSTVSYTKIDPAQGLRLSDEGQITASSANFSGDVISRISRDATVEITDANSGSYFQYVDAIVSPGPGIGTADRDGFIRLRLDGASISDFRSGVTHTTGEQVRRVKIATTQFPTGTKTNSSNTRNWQYAIGDIFMPDISAGANMEIVIEIASTEVYFRNDVGGFAAGKVFTAV